MSAFHKMVVISTSREVFNIQDINFVRFYFYFLFLCFPSFHFTYALSLTRLALETSEEVTYPMFLLMLFPFAIPYQSHGADFVLVRS